MSAIQLKDSNGVALVVGQTVKIVGTVVSLDPFSTDFHEVTISLNDPIAVEDTQVAPSGTNNRPASGLARTLNVPALILTVGA